MGAFNFIEDAVRDVGSGIDDFVNDVIPGGWTTAALLAGGYYFAPQIGAFVNGAGATVPTSALAAESSFVAADAAQLAAQGLSTAQIEATLASTGIDSFIAADAAQLAAQGLSGSQISSTLAAAGETAAASGGLTASQMANLAKAGISLAGVAGAANVAGGTGGLGLSQQDRSGFSSGSANYSPEYYQQIQSKYNQYMPQAKGADITTDLKNWYETKYTPNATVSGTPSGTTTGTGYTTPTSLTNLKVPVIPKVVPPPSYTLLDPNKSTATDVASEYAKYIAKLGGNTQANRAEAERFLIQQGFSGPQINSAYNQYLSTLPASTGTTAETMAANATPAQIAQAYAGFVQSNGGDTQANQAKAIQYLQQIGVPYATIEAAYPVFKSTYGSVAAPTTTAGGGGGGSGMLTGGGGGSSAASQPSYTSLSGSSSPAAIAAAYKDYVASAGGDTQANQAAAQSYLANLGVSSDTVNQAYGLFKG